MWRVTPVARPPPRASSSIQMQDVSHSGSLLFYLLVEFTIIEEQVFRELFLVEVLIWPIEHSLTILSPNSRYLSHDCFSRLL